MLETTPQQADPASSPTNPKSPNVSQNKRFKDGEHAATIVPHSLLALYTPRQGRDPLGILTEQNKTRVQDLVPLRMFRMSEDPFAFMRGAAAIMASDLGNEPRTGINVFVCGDAHINNFGVFSTLGNELVFDVNDFDEATLGPWEWDVKRLAASIFLAGAVRGDKKDFIEKSALDAVRAYRDSIHLPLSMAIEDRFFEDTYASDGADDPSDKSTLGKTGAKVATALQSAVVHARKRTDTRAEKKMTALDKNGNRVLIQDPPILTPFPKEARSLVKEAYANYRAQLPANLRLFLDQQTLTDLAVRVVGVGSVGTRCYVALFTGPDGEPFILQQKQAVQSALNQWGGVPIPPNNVLDPKRAMKEPGYRPLTCQQAMQEAPDAFLGAINAGGHSFYVRQFRDENEGIDVTTLSQSDFTAYVKACAAQLARAHGRSEGGASIAGYVGHSDSFPHAITHWAKAYAKQSKKDYAALKEAIAAGELPTLTPEEAGVAPKSK